MILNKSTTTPAIADTGLSGKFVVLSFVQSMVRRRQDMDWNQLPFDSTRSQAADYLALEEHHKEK